MKTIYFRFSDDFTTLPLLGPCAPKIYPITKKTAGRVPPWQLFHLASKRPDGGWNLTQMQKAVEANSSMYKHKSSNRHPKAFVLAIRYLGLPESYFLKGFWGQSNYSRAGMFSRDLPDGRSQLVNFDYEANEDGLIHNATWQFYIGPSDAVEAWSCGLQGEFGNKPENVSAAIKSRGISTVRVASDAEWERVWPDFA